MIDPTKPLRTKGTKEPVELISTNGRGAWPWLGYVSTSWKIDRWDTDGKFNSGGDYNDLDLENIRIPESKAEQGEKNSEGKQVDQCTKEDFCRCEPPAKMLTQCDAIKAWLSFNELQWWSDFSRTWHDFARRDSWDSPWLHPALASCEHTFRIKPQTNTQLPPAEKPSPSPKTKRVPLTKSHFDGQAVIWVKGEGREFLAEGISEGGLWFDEYFNYWSTLMDHNLYYSYDRVTWHPFFAEVADE